MEQNNIYCKIAEVRVELQNANCKKSGKNGFANFDYFTLEDILPTINNLMLKHRLLSVFNMNNEYATLTYINADAPTEQVQFSCPVAEAEIKGSTPIQCLGGEITYLRRYLILTSLEVTEGDSLDALAGSDKLVTKQDKKVNEINKPQSAKIIKTDDIKQQMITPQPKKVEEITVKEMSLKEALEVSTFKGRKLKELTQDQLQVVADKSLDPIRKKAAQIILDNWNNLNDFVDTPEDDMGDLPF